MTFEDRVLVRLADDATRAGVFDQEALEQLLEAAYDGPALGVQGPFTADFAEFGLGVTARPLGTLEGSWSETGATDRTEARFRVSGVGDVPQVRVDALWRGAVIGRFAVGGEPVTQVSTTIPDAETLEARVTYAAPAGLVATPRPLPVSVAILVRDAGASLTGLVAESSAVRELLGTLGLERPANGGPRPRRPLVVCWIVPPALFDDPDWPGATGGMSAVQARAARRARAGGWLAREGIGLAVTT